MVTHVFSKNMVAAFNDCAIFESLRDETRLHLEIASRELEKEERRGALGPTIAD